MKKIFLDELKAFVENFLSLKPIKFYLRAFNKVTNKWQEVIQNNSEYAIDSNQFIVLLDDNKKPHSARNTQKKVLNLHWSVLLYLLDD